MNIKVEDGKVKCKCGCQNFRIELDGKIIKLSCAKCALDIGSMYVKEEMIYYSKRDGYREALDEMKDFIFERQEMI